MARRQAQRVRPRHGTENRDGSRVEGVAEQPFVRRARHPVEDDARDRHVVAVIDEAFGERRHRGALAPRVHHQHHERPQLGREVGGGPGAVAGAVEEAHRTLADDEVRVRAEHRHPAREGLGPHPPGVEIDAVVAAGHAVIAGVDVIGPRLEGSHGDVRSYGNAPAGRRTARSCRCRTPVRRG